MHRLLRDLNYQIRGIQDFIFPKKSRRQNHKKSQIPGIGIFCRVGFPTKKPLVETKSHGKYEIFENLDFVTGIF